MASAPLSERDRRRIGSYRPEIDGLRALAVVAVIIFHLNQGVLPSGYLGVDVFFVISGYVITASLLHRPCDDRRQFLLAFYNRRVMRLAPALIVYVLITGLLVCLFDPTPVSTLFTGFTALFGASNLYLLRESTDYFAESAHLNPFLNTWSLGVEEQFYFLFPVLFLFFFSSSRIAESRRRSLFLAVLCGLSVASLLLFMLLNRADTAAAYFLMPARFWEIAAGSITLLLVLRRRHDEAGGPPWLPWVLLVALGGLFFLPSGWPILTALAACLITAGLIYCTNAASSVYGLMTAPPVLHLGRLSYSLYLWHWGVLSLSYLTIGLHAWTIPLQIALIYGLSYLSYRCIESPARRSPLFPGLAVNLTAGIGLTAVASLAVVPGLNSAFQNLYLGTPPVQPRAAPFGTQISEDKCDRLVGRSLAYIDQYCRLTAKGGPTIFAFGDSQTGHLLPLLNQLHARDGYGVFMYASSGVNFPSIPFSRSDGKTLDEWKRKYQHMLRVYRHALSTAAPGDILLLSSRFEFQWAAYPIPLAQRSLKIDYHAPDGQKLTRSAAYRQWIRELESLVAEAEKRAMHVVFFSGLPTFEQELPAALSDPQWFNALNYRNRFVDRSFLVAHYDPVDRQLRRIAARSGAAHYFDVLSAVCPPADKFCSTSAGGTLLFRDESHLSVAGNALLYEHFAPFLASEIVRGAPRRSNGSPVTSRPLPSSEASGPRR